MTRAAQGWLIAAAAATVLVLAAVAMLVWQPWHKNQSFSTPTSSTSPAAIPSTNSLSAPPPPAAPGSSPSATAAPIALPDLPPSNSGCQGTVTAQHDVKHKSLGVVRVFLLVNPWARYPSEKGCIAAVASSKTVLPAIPVAANQKFGFADPATDATGNTFVTYNNGRYDGVLVLIPDAEGFENIGWEDAGQHYYGKHAYYYAEVVGPGADGEYTIRQSHNDCTPDCATGTITTQDLHWNGNDYVP